MLHAGQAFAMPNIEGALGYQQSPEAFDQPLLSRAVEVDHDVAAEDDVEWTAHRPGVVHQVQPGETDQPLQFGLHPPDPGWAFVDQIQGDDGNDVLTGGGQGTENRGDWLTGGSGDDQLTGSGNGLVLGGEDNDTLFAFAGDLARGDGGNDTITGHAGTQQIIGGSGDDTLTGGADFDRFDFSDGWGADRIADFQDGIDKFDLSNVTGLNAFGQLSVTAAAEGALIAFSGNTILLSGIAVALITADDFTL